MKNGKWKFNEVRCRLALYAKGTGMANFSHLLCPCHIWQPMRTKRWPERISISQPCMQRVQGWPCMHFIETYQDDITSRKWKLHVTCWSFVMYTTIIVLTGCFAPSRSTTSKQPFLTVRPNNRSRRLVCHPVHCPVHRPKTWSHPSHCNLTWHQLGTSSSRLKSTTWKKCDSTRLENKLTYSWLQTDLDKSRKLGLQCKLQSCYS